MKGRDDQKSSICPECGSKVLIWDLSSGEKTVRELSQRVVEGVDLPRLVYGEEPEEVEIPVIRHASIDGLVEISRGCGRHRQFCTPTVWRRRDFPVEKILREVEINIKAGVQPILNSEDGLLYGSRDPRFVPYNEKILNLFSRVLSQSGVYKVDVSHISLAPVVADEKLIQDLSDLLQIGSDGIRYFGVQTGVETGA